MTKDKALEELFLAKKPHFDDHDTFMANLTKRLDAVEFIHQHQEATIRRYKMAMIATFVIGIISGAITMAFILSMPADVPLFNFNVHTGLLLWFTEISRPVVATALALLMTIGSISVIINIQDINTIMKMNKKTIITALLAATFGLVSCNSDSDYEDKVEQVTVYVSAETGMFYNVPNTTLEEGMMIRGDGENNYICVAFNTIAGFTYEKGNEYELLVKKNKLANPPKDSGSIRYELIRIVSQRKVE